MKAVLVYWHKARLHGRYVLEMEIHSVGRSVKYPDGVKYGLILTDLRSGKRVLMDNHHPKGPHIHLNGQEIPYQYSDEEKLIQDFKALVLENMGVKI
ncbi:MAG: hypothetical protein HYS22_05690 [Deltaproteobacteria bacterium]|nr:hypothetical protein [Deltaproteobacteria bacterium]